jgi:hypothetical protein
VVSEAARGRREREGAGGGGLLTAEDEARLLPGLVSDHDGARADPGGPGAGAASSSPRRALGTAGALLMRIAARGARPPASAPRDP